MPANLHCPYKNICRHFPNCQNDYEMCRFFIMAEAEKDIRPVKWRPGPRS